MGDWLSSNAIAILGMALGGLVAYLTWQKAIAVQFVKLDTSMDMKLAAMEKNFDGKFSALAIQINTIMMRDIVSLQARLTTTEADAVGLHRCIHQIEQDLNGVGLKVDRLERPGRTST